MTNLNPKPVISQRLRAAIFTEVAQTEPAARPGGGEEPVVLYWDMDASLYKIKPDQSYILHCWQEPAPGPDQPPAWRFGLQEVLGEARQHNFDSLEEMMNFLIDQLLGQPTEE